MKNLFLTVALVFACTSTAAKADEEGCCSNEGTSIVITNTAVGGSARIVTSRESVSRKQVYMYPDTVTYAYPVPAEKISPENDNKIEGCSFFCGWFK